MEELVTGGLLFTPVRGCDLTWCLLLHSFSVSHILLPGGSGVLADPATIYEFQKSLAFPTFVALGKGKPALRNSLSWLPLLPVMSLPELTGEMLADVVRRKGATAGSLDGWGWRETKVLPVAWFARILPKVEEIGVWREGLPGCLQLPLIPKADGDATPFGQRPLILLPVVYRYWASARMVHLEEWLRSWFLTRSSVLVVMVGVQLRHGEILPWTWRRFYLKLLTVISIYLLRMLSSHSILLIVVSWIRFGAV